MDIIGWLKLFGLAVQLFNQTEMNNQTIVHYQLDTTNSQLFHTVSGLPSLSIQVQQTNTNELLTTYVLLPWQDLYEPKTTNGDAVQQALSKQFYTVMEFALVYCTFEKSNLSDEQKSILDKYKKFFIKLFDIDNNNTIIRHSDGITSPQGLQIISKKEYPFYEVQDIAVPGSKTKTSAKKSRSIKGKMVQRNFIPDYGTIKSEWKSYGNPINDKCILKKQREIVALFESALLECLTNPKINRKMIYENALIDLDEIFNTCTSKTNFTTNFGKDLLKRLLSPNEPGLRELFEDNPFSGYQPKRTPDISSDYMPSVDKYFKSLPSAKLSYLCKLFSQFKKYRTLAKRNPGKWVDGNMILGARPKEYEPSLEELILAEIGERINQIILNNSSDSIAAFISARKCKPGKIQFKKFTFTHSDVMGSGRFFYVDRIEETHLKLTE
jgi:hypothetical protein